MQLVVVLACLASAVQAATFSNSAFVLQAGTTFDITWTGGTGPVSLELRNGDPRALQSVETIATGLSPGPGGIGSFPWPVPGSLPGSGPYALIITDNTGPNYSEQFPIQGVQVSAPTSAVTQPTVSPSPSLVPMSASTTVVMVTSTTITASSFSPTVSTLFPTASSLSPIPSSLSTTTSVPNSTPSTPSSTNTPSSVLSVSSMLSRSFTSTVSAPSTSTSVSPTASIPHSSAPATISSTLALLLLSAIAMFLLQ